jgi:hypothetical protein
MDSLREVFSLANRPKRKAGNMIILEYAQFAWWAVYAIGLIGSLCVMKGRSASFRMLPCGLGLGLVLGIARYVQFRQQNGEVPIVPHKVVMITLLHFLSFALVVAGAIIQKPLESDRSSKDAAPEPKRKERIPFRNRKSY